MPTERSEFVALIPALRAFARTLSRDGSEADDLVQETLMKGIANINRFQPGTSLKAWLFTIMRNTFYTRIKRANREGPGLLDCASSRPAIAASQEWRLRSQEMARAIDALPDDQRQVIVLIGVLGTSYDDAASICGCAIGTIKSRLSRARNRLLETLGETSSEDAVITRTFPPPSSSPTRRRFRSASFDAVSSDPTTSQRWFPRSSPQQ
ncbi:MAG TPA: sigma-70 family RNA polymerase sigma factor [Pseudaminobacter sp.]|nr:sigma-70 family RNA polymerase sigma factor [Pseudaminobacter sp.]